MDDKDAKAQAFVHRLLDFANTDQFYKFIQEHSINFDQQNEQGWTLLLSACVKRRFDVIGYIMDNTTKVDCRLMPNHMTVLHLAIIAANGDMLDSRAMVDEMIATPARLDKLRSIVNVPNANKDTPLMMACVVKDDDVVRKLLYELHADVIAKNAAGMTALMCAARLPSGEEYKDEADRSESESSSVAILEALTETAADDNVKIQELVDSQDYGQGNTALHLAVMSNNLSGVRYLLQGSSRASFSADVSIQNKFKQTPLDVARALEGQIDAAIIQLLQEQWEENTAKALKALSELETTEDKKQTSAAVSRKGYQRRKQKKKKRTKNSTETTQKRDTTDDSCHSNSTHEEVAGVFVPNAESSQSAQKDASQPYEQKHREEETKAAMSEQHEGGTLDVETTSQDQTASASRSSSRLASDKSHTYESLQSLFEAMVPMATELEIDVDKFLITRPHPKFSGQSSGSIDDLSFSQVDALQEAHLQAYHYLNERKVELTRQLEAQRLQAELELQYQLFRTE